MAFTLAACRPLAARRAQAARRAPVVARRPRLLPPGVRGRPSRPLLCTGQEREPEPAEAPAPEQQQPKPKPASLPPLPPPPPRLVPQPPPQPAASRRAQQQEDDKLPRPKAPVHPFLAFFSAFFSARKLGRHLLNLVAFTMLAQLIGAGMHKAGGTSEPPVRQVVVGYSEFLNAARTGKVSYVQLDGKQMTWLQREAPVALSAPKEAARDSAAVASAVPAPAATRYVTIRPDDAVLPYDKLLANGAGFHAVSRAGQWSVMNVFNVVVTVLWLLLMASAVSGRAMPGLGVFKSRVARQNKRNKRESPEVTFADVAGVDEAKEELQEVVEILKSPERFLRLGARPPTGVLLVGPPGTGKTLLAKAVAGEAGVPFFSVAASEFVELYVGMGASRVREVFARAKAAAPAIVFIDEIDAVAKSRGDGRMRHGGNDEREQTLNQLLTELDGFDSSALVICLAATNRVDTLDAAVRRPGRFDRTVAVDRPDRKGREEILGVHVRSMKVPLAKDVELADVAKDTAGFTGAELANVVNEAALLAARRGEDAVDVAAFESAVMRASLGIERKRSLLSGAEKTAVARHEAGHAIVGAAVSTLLPAGGYRTESISLSSRSNGVLGSLGNTKMAQTGEDRTMYFADEFRGQLAMMLGGRAAEELSASGRVSTGAADDIQRATKLSYTAVAEWGFSASVGPVALLALSGGGGDLFGRESGAAAAAVEAEVSLLLKGALEAARATLLANASLLDRLGATLEADEKVAGPRLAAFLAKAVVPPQLQAFVTEPQNAVLRLLPPPKEEQ